MIKNLLFIFCFITVYAGAQTRSIENAMDIASQFNTKKNATLKQKAPKTTSSLKLAYTKRSLSVKNDSITSYYVLNNSDNSGFVIVSGDERAIPVLAYSDESSFDPNNIPTNTKYLLDLYAIEIANLSTNQPSKIQLASSESAASTATTPLLGNIKWNQDDPYNMLCPYMPSTTNRTVTGCVATGMAQVMKYYNWPVTGTGSNSYTSTTNSLAVSANFGTTTYDWANMTDTYSSTSTTAQKNAVATLMYHCGAAVNMDYGLSSSASIQAMALALKNNFGYDGNIQRYYRPFYTRDEWSQLIAHEIDAARPVLYSGQSNDGGHLFVCDGYDSNGLFHINWGWGGSSNGYFVLSVLNPYEQGIGGGSGAYDEDQVIITGIQKPSTSSTPSFIINMYDTITYTQKSITRNSTFNLKFTKTYNMGLNTLTGSIAVALFDANNNYTIIKSLSGTLAANYGWSSLDFTNISIPSGLSGNYKLHLVYKDNAQSAWQIVKTPVGTPHFLYVDVNSTTVNFSTNHNIQAKLSLNSLSPIGKIYQNKNGRFSVSVSNTASDYNSLSGIYLQSTTNQSINQLVSNEQINVIAGETLSFTFEGNVTLAPGQYYLAFMHDPLNNPENAVSLETLGNIQTVTIYATPTATPTLSLTTPISFSNNNSVDKSSAELTAKVLNTTGFYDKKLIAFIFETTGGSSLTYLGYQTAYIDANETGTIKFRGPIDLTPKTYMVNVYYQNDNNTWTSLTPSSYARINFTLVDNSLTSANNISQNNSIKIFRNTSNSYIIESPNEINSLIITDISGRIVESAKVNSTTFTIDSNKFNNGIYILKANTSTGSEIIKFNATK